MPRTAGAAAQARSLGRDTYEPLPAGGLAGQVIQTAGAGTLEDPAVFTVTLTNTGAALWQGVVLAELVFPCRDPRFFLPGFLYGRNRGEAPLRVGTLFPRLRPGPAQKPAAPGWMVRGDQLSHPAAFALDGGRLYGISGGPYLVESAGRRRLWAPGAGGALHRFAGFTCSLEAGSVGHTLGYENAPWLFIQSHRVEDRPPLGRVGWSSCGGSITSTANPHIHPMSSTVLDEISYLLARRPSAYLAARFRDTLAWSCQNHNTFDGEYDYGRTGWMSERFCYGQGLLVQRYPDGSPASTWFALMRWACASILEGLTGLCWGEP